MKLFVAGATGVLGWRSVKRLVEAGHDVTGIARSDEKAKLLTDLGATPARIDLFDAGQVKDAVAGHEGVLNLATHIPPTSKYMLPGVWKENDRIRTEGSRNLVDAALATGAQRYVQESIAFLYPDSPDDAWLDEATPLDAPKHTQSVLAAEAQARRFTDSGGTGAVLRFGFFYGHDAHHSHNFVSMVRRRLSPTMGGPDAYQSSIHLDDAATAVVAALNVPAGIYNVVDDEPVTNREYGDIIADALGVKRPRVVPAAVGKMGGSKIELLARSQRVSNKRFKNVSSWAPQYPSVREGWPAVVAEMAKTA